MLDSLLPAIVEMINAYGEEQERVTALRRMILDECHLNLDLLGVLQTRCVEAAPAERARLCAALRSDSQQVLQVAKIDERTLFAQTGRNRLFGLLQQSHLRERQQTDFRGWSSYELYHYVHNKIAALRILADGDEAVLAQLRLRLRIRNIQRALQALLRHLKQHWQLEDGAPTT